MKPEFYEQLNPKDRKTLFIRMQGALATISHCIRNVIDGYGSISLEEIDEIATKPFERKGE